MRALCCSCLVLCEIMNSSSTTIYLTSKRKNKIEQFKQYTIQSYTVILSLAAMFSGCLKIIHTFFVIKHCLTVVIAHDQVGKLVAFDVLYRGRV
jgi:hypothetical protein